MRRGAVRAGRAILVTALALAGTSLLAARAGATSPSFPPLQIGSLPSISGEFYSGQVLDVSCATAGNCTAVGEYQRNAGNGAGETEGFVSEETGAAWASATSVAPPAPLAGTALASTPSSDLAPIFESISCSSPGNCTAVGNASAFGDDEAIAATETDGTWGSTEVIASPYLPAIYFDLAAVSCSSAGNCTAVGSYTHSGGFIFTATQTDGTWSTPSTLTPPSDILASTSPNPYGISCPSAGDCVLVGDYVNSSGYQGMTAISSGGTFAPATATVPPTGATGGELDAVWCSSTADCVAVGFAAVSGIEHGLAVTETTGTWSQGISTDDDAGNTTLTSLQCTDTSDCTAIGTLEVATETYEVLGAVESSGNWAPPVDGPSTNGGATGACVGTTCEVAYSAPLGKYSAPSVTSFAGASFTTATALAMPTDALVGQDGFYFGASCPDSSTCEVLGAYLDESGSNLQPYVATYVDNSLTSLTTLDFTEPNSSSTNYLGGISCSSTGDCAAYFSGQGYGQRLDLESSGAWGAPTTLPIAEEVTGVSCVTSSWCLVVGTDTSAYVVGDDTYPEGFSLTDDDGTWDAAPTLVSGTSNLSGVSCWAAGDCEAVGFVVNSTDHGLAQEIGVELSSSRWQTTDLVAPPYANPNGWTGSLNGVACDSSGRCLAVGGYSESATVEGTYAVSNLGAWGTASTSTIPSGGVAADGSLYRGVTCVDGSDCVAIGQYTDTDGSTQAMYASGDTTSGDLASETAETSPSTSSTSPAEEPTYENGVACMSPTDCLIVGNFWPNANQSLPALAFSGTPPPGAPTDVMASGAFGQVTVSWDAPSVDDGPPVTSYVATAGADSCTTTALTCTITGLADEATYAVSVSALSSAGEGPGSTPILVTVITTPGAPTDVRATPADGLVHGRATISWTAPSDDGASPITSYQVNVTSSSPSSDAGAVDCPPAQGACTVPTTNGVVYEVSVEARNAAGFGPASAPIRVESIGRPSPPPAVVALAGNAKLTVRWTLPVSDGGAPITGYVARAGTQTCTSRTTSCVIPGLTNGRRYGVTVRAENAAGLGAASPGVIGEPTSGRAPGPPGPVRSLEATPKMTVVMLTWKLPSSDGAGIAYFAVCLDHSRTNCVHLASPSLTTYTWGALEGGTTYTFSVTVYAVNGQASATRSVAATTKS